jgi:hypothetical protein
MKKRKEKKLPEAEEREIPEGIPPLPKGYVYIGTDKNNQQLAGVEFDGDIYNEEDDDDWFGKSYAVQFGEEDYLELGVHHVCIHKDDPHLKKSEPKAPLPYEVVDFRLKAHDLNVKIVEQAMKGLQDYWNSQEWDQPAEVLHKAKEAFAKYKEAVEDE